MRLFLFQLLTLALLVVFFVSVHELARPSIPDCAQLCRAASTSAPCAIDTSSPGSDPGYPEPLTYEDVRANERRRCSLRKFPYCHALPIPFFRPLDEDYFDVWPELGCARDLVPDDYPEGMCGPTGVEFMCAPSPLAPLR